MPPVRFLAVLLFVIYHMSDSSEAPLRVAASPAVGLLRRMRRPLAVREMASVSSKPDTKVTSHQVSSLSTFLRRVLIPLSVLYVAMFAVLSVSHRAQNYLIYLHWLKPPMLYPLTDLRAYKLAAVGRNVRAGHLRGWHLLPPGPPFAPAETSLSSSSRRSSSSSSSLSSEDGMSTNSNHASNNDNTNNNNNVNTEDVDVDRRDAFFESRLSAPGQTIVLFLHGNSGTRACPGKRVDAVKLLNAQLRAHVVTFDYSGFGDSPGRPTERSLGADARTMLTWILTRAAENSTVLVYGQSLGSFAAVDVLSSEIGGTSRSADGLILDAAPASLVAAALTHPVARAFRILPYNGMERLFKWVLRERLDSQDKIGKVSVPVLILHGKRDRMISVDQGELLARKARLGGNEQVEFHAFADCGHVDVSSAPAYLSILYAFVQRVTRNA